MIGPNSLEYGVVVDRLENGEWWNGHIIRSDLEYHCELLGRRTNLLFLMVKFGCGATQKSLDFYLTLDAEGVSEDLLPIRVTGSFGVRENDSELRIEGLHIRAHILSHMHDSQQFQSAMASIVCHQIYNKIADAKHFSRIKDDF